MGDEKSLCSKDGCGDNFGVDTSVCMVVAAVVAVVSVSSITMVAMTR